MGIKWENVKILNSPLNNRIYLGRLDKTGMRAIDKSSDRTEEVIAAVIAHLDEELNEGKTKISYSIPKGMLTWERNSDTISSARMIEQLINHPHKVFKMINYNTLMSEYPHQIDGDTVTNFSGKICYNTENKTAVRLTYCFLEECKWKEVKGDEIKNE
jgi:hypothetical protein